MFRSRPALVLTLAASAIGLALGARRAQAQEYFGSAWRWSPSSLCWC